MLIRKSLESKYSNDVQLLTFPSIKDPYSQLKTFITNNKFKLPFPIQTERINHRISKTCFQIMKKYTTTSWLHSWIPFGILYVYSSETNINHSSSWFPSSHSSRMSRVYFSCKIKIYWNTRRDTNSASTI